MKTFSIPDSKSIETLWQKIKDRSIPVKDATNGIYDDLSEEEKMSDVVYIVDGSENGNSGSNCTCSNPNLLDNAYWAVKDSIVNQKRFTSLSYDISLGMQYSYFIDRWMFGIEYVSSEVELINDGVKLHPGGYVQQILDTFNVNTIGGKIVTFSVLYDNSLITSSFLWDLENRYEVLKDDGVVQLCYYGAKREFINPYVRIYNKYDNDAPTSVLLKAAKLELGDTQTLAHQDEDGNWVLNDPPPNYALELAKCQRYMVVLNPSSAYEPIGAGVTWAANSAEFFIPLPVSMRAVPSIIGTGAYRLIGVGTNNLYSFSTNPFVSYKHCESSVSISTTTLSGLTANRAYILQLDVESNIIFDANL